MAKKRTLPDFIQKRRRRYYAVLEIPASLRHHYPSTDKKGKPTGRNLVRLVRSLETDSLTVAQRRAGAIVNAWKSEFARLKNEGDDAVFFRHRLQKAKSDAEKRQIMSEIELAAGDISATYPDNPTAAQIADIEQHREERRSDFLSRATGQIVGMTDHLDAFLDRQTTEDKTKAMAKSDVLRFATSFPTVQDVTYEGVQRWVDGLGVAPATVKRSLSAIRGYWKYLQRPDVKAVPRDFQPFNSLDLPKPRNGPKETRRPFEPKDVVKLLIAATAKEETLAALIRIGMWTGCRIEEICSLQTKHVHLRASIPYFEIEDAKTSAGWRQVPIHTVLSNEMAQLVKNSADGYLLSGLSVNKYGDRSPAIGHAFGRLKAKLGFGEQHVFHSIRKTVVTQLENAGIPENVVADIVGHEKPRITYGLYSGGTTLKVKAEALSKLSYASKRS